MGSAARPSCIAAAGLIFTARAANAATPGDATQGRCNSYLELSMETSLPRDAGDAARKPQHSWVALFVVGHIVAVALMWSTAAKVAQAHAGTASDHSFKLSLFPVPESAK